MARAWMYQLNPSKGRFDIDGEFVPTSTENLFRLFERENPVGAWGISQFFNDAQPGDPLLLKIGGTEKEGGVALGWVHRISFNRIDDAYELFWVPDRAASELLRADPLPYEWLQGTIPKSQRNLVDIAPYWSKVNAALEKRGIHFERPGAFEGELLHAQGSGPALSEEGRQQLLFHFSVERSARNRRLVLASRRKPHACEVCGFVFERAYGAELAGYIQVHYRVPVSTGPRRPSVNDFALLCANCHAANHWGRGVSPRSVEELGAAWRTAQGSGSGAQLRDGKGPPPMKQVVFTFRVDEMRAAEHAFKQVVMAVLIASEPMDTRPTVVEVRSGDILNMEQAKLLARAANGETEGYAVSVRGPGDLLTEALQQWPQLAPAESIGSDYVDGDPGLVLRTVILDGVPHIERGDTARDLESALAELGMPVELVGDGALGAAEAAGGAWDYLHQIA